MAKRNPKPSVRRCRVCGCTDAAACDGGCYWVGPDLCSACEPMTPAVLMATVQCYVKAIPDGVAVALRSGPVTIEGTLPREAARELGRRLLDAGQPPPGPPAARPAKKKGAKP